MSADNWARCPRCATRRETTLVEDSKALEADYGVIPAVEWMERKAALDNAISTPQEITLREDYEFYGAEDGAVQVSYSCGCDECGLRFSFQETYPIPTEEETR